MRSRSTILVGLVLALAIVAAACSSDDTGDESTTTTEAATTSTTTTKAAETTTTAAPDTTTTEAMEAIELVIWTDEQRAPVLEEVAPKVLEETGVALTIEQFDFDDLRDLVTRAAPAGEGPDIFIGAHDWTGDLAADGIAAPIDLGGRENEWVDVSKVAFNYGGSLYGLPYATEAIALYYNADLVPEPPTTFEDMTAICDGLEGIDNCLGIPGGADDVTQAAYHHYPWVSVFGGYIFGFSPETGYDTTDIGLDSEEAIAGVTALETLITEGYVGNVTQDDAKKQFLAGTSPFFLSGPWQLDDFNDAGINFGVAKMPTAAGSAPGPFVGAQGFFINSFSDNVGIAQAFLLDYVATEDVMMALYEADPRSQAYLPTFDAVAADNEIAATFALSAADGQPMPNIPEMVNVWGPLGDQMNGLRNGKTDAATAMRTAATQVREAVGG